MVSLDRAINAFPNINDINNKYVRQNTILNNIVPKGNQDHNDGKINRCLGLYLSRICERDIIEFLKVMITDDAYKHHKKISLSN